MNNMEQVETESDHNRIRRRINRIFTMGPENGRLNMIEIDTLTDLLASDSNLEKDFWKLSKDNMRTVAVNGGFDSLSAGLIMTFARGKDDSGVLFKLDGFHYLEVSESDKLPKPAKSRDKSVEKFEKFLRTTKLFAAYLNVRFSSRKTDMLQNRHLRTPRSQSGFRYRILLSILLALKEIYGEEPMLELFDRCRAEEERPLITDFVRILENWDELKDYPLSWSSTLV